MKYDVVILTEGKYINPVAVDWYVEQVLLEERLLQEALEDLHLRVIRADWADIDFDWSQTKTAVFRATWDYFHRFQEFSEWLKKASALTRLINSEKLIRWNVDKHYLNDLFAQSVNIVPSRFIRRNTRCDLQALCTAIGGDGWVLKPTVSGAARHTYRLNEENVHAHQSVLDGLLVGEDMILQPFINSIPTLGELSLIVMNGEVTHAVRKIAKPGDFRVQDDFGGSVHPHEATKEEQEFAIRAVRACPEMPLYARVDMVIDNNGNLAISELELIEPELWMRLHPLSAGVLARCILEVVRTL
jgi:glutathione synthase/RimK-type ligase-like ATP-grasp enzyme